MKKFTFIFFTLTAIVSLFAQSYKVSVDVYVGTRIEDKFYFEMNEGEAQVKGFNGKMLAKRYRSQGFPHSKVQFFESEKKLEEEKKEEAKRTPTEIAEAKLAEYDRKIRELERRAESSVSQKETISQKRDTLSGLIEKFGKNPRMMEKSFGEFLETNETKKEVDENYQRLMRRQPKTSDTEEIDIGSYFNIKILKAYPKGITANLNMSYSRLVSFFYADGNNNNNTITKQLTHEKFEKFGIKAHPLEFGKPYCFQFGRPENKDSANSLSEAESRTQLFGEKNETLRIEETEDVEAQPASPLDAQGAFSEIKKKYKNDEGKVVRFVIKVTKSK